MGYTPKILHKLYIKKYHEYIPKKYFIFNSMKQKYIKNHKYINELYLSKDGRL